MGLWAEIEKLITEHGSAAILREKVGLLEAQREAAVREQNKLSKEVSSLNQKVEIIKEEKTKLLSELDEARRELLILKTSKNVKHELDETSEKMLILIANRSEGTIDNEMIQHLGFQQAKGKYHLDQLRKRGFVHSGSGIIGRGSLYYATTEGREYLANNGLL